MSRIRNNENVHGRVRNIVHKTVTFLENALATIPTVAIEVENITGVTLRVATNYLGVKR